MCILRYSFFIRYHIISFSIHLQKHKIFRNVLLPELCLPITNITEVKGIIPVSVIGPIFLYCANIARKYSKRCILIYFAEIIYTN